MANIASPVALVNYNPVSDSAVIVYEIPVAVNKVSLLARTIGTSDNAKVTINKSGLLDAVNVLEKAGVVNFLATQAGATATGLVIAGSGFVDAAVTALSTNQAGGAVVAKDLTIITAGAADTGVTFDVITPCRTKKVINNTTTTKKVYPLAGDFFEGVALSATGITLAAGECCVFWSDKSATTGGIWKRLI